MYEVAHALRYWVMKHCAEELLHEEHNTTHIFEIMMTIYC